MSLQLNDFIKLLPAGGCVLDAGCGSGRDSLTLKNKGFSVEAFDASEEMCKRASDMLGQQVKLCRFEELDYKARFDGIWACASFKKGIGERYRGNRRFTDADETYLRSILKNKFDIIEIRESIDVRPGREDEAKEENQSLD